MALWLTNPKRRARKVRRHKRRKLAGAALAAHLRKIGKRSKRRTGTARRAGKRVASQGGIMAKRKRRRANPKRRRRHVAKAVVRRRRRHNPVIRHKRRRHYRRNPAGGLVGSMMALGKQGVKDGAGVVIGKVATNTVAGLIPFGSNAGLTGAVKKVVTALAVGYGANRVMGREFARMVVAGGFAGVYETLLKTVSIPVIGPFIQSSLADPGYAALGLYPRGNGLQAYPLAGVGDGVGYGDGSTGGDYSWEEM
jgi:hypothetical protein